MLTHDEKQMFRRVIDELETCRKQNAIMTAQLAIVDVFAAVVGLKEKPQGFSEDIVWKLKQTLRKYEEEEKDQKLQDPNEVESE